VARTGKERNAYRILVGKAEGKRPLEKPWCRREVNMKKSLKERGWESMEGINLDQARENWWILVNTKIKDWDFIKGGNFLTSGETVSFSRRTLSQLVSQTDR
jgi:hypothetical protein